MTQCSTPNGINGNVKFRIDLKLPPEPMVNAKGHQRNYSCERDFLLALS
jgi:hypothetical protein